MLDAGCFAASAMILPCRISPSMPAVHEFWTLNAPYALVSARSMDARSSKSACTISTPRSLNTLEAALSGVRDVPRTRHFPAATSLRATAPPWRPVAPATTINRSVLISSSSR